MRPGFLALIVALSACSVAPSPTAPAAPHSSQSLPAGASSRAVLEEGRAPSPEPSASGAASPPSPERQAPGAGAAPGGRRRFTRERFEQLRGEVEDATTRLDPSREVAIGSVAVPFARFLNLVHVRVHLIFAQGFLDSIETLPASNPLQTQSLSTILDLEFGRDGSLVRARVIRRSGVTMFDVAALLAMHDAAPFPAPPPEIVSFDGVVHVQWELFRQRDIACSMINARPFLMR